MHITFFFFGCILFQIFIHDWSLETFELQSCVWGLPDGWICSKNYKLCFQRSITCWAHMTSYYVWFPTQARIKFAVRVHPSSVHTWMLKNWHFQRVSICIDISIEVYCALVSGAWSCVMFCRIWVKYGIFINAVFILKISCEKNCHKRKLSDMCGGAPCTVMK